MDTASAKPANRLAEPHQATVLAAVVETGYVRAYSVNSDKELACMTLCRKNALFDRYLSLHTGCEATIPTAGRLDWHVKTHFNAVNRVDYSCHPFNGSAAIRNAGI